MATDLPSGVQTSSPAAPPPGAIPVYNVASPTEARTQKIDFIKVYGHSNLLYWWPVWAVCFLLAGLTYLNGAQMAVVPAGSQVVEGETVPGFDGPREVLVAPAGQRFSMTPPDAAPATDKGVVGRVADRLMPSQMTVARSNSLGVVFCMTVLLTAVVSSITLRGMVSIIVIVGLVVLVLALSLWNLWDDVFRFFGGLDVRMNAAGYLFLGIPLLAAWLIVVLLYDRGSYVLFDEGQIRYVREIGENELVVPAEGSQVEKKRADVFRHWLVGFGSGDLVIRTGGSSGQSIELENVIGIGRKLEVINTMLRKKAISVG